MLLALRFKQSDVVISEDGLIVLNLTNDPTSSGPVTLITADGASAEDYRRHDLKHAKTVFVKPPGRIELG